MPRRLRFERARMRGLVRKDGGARDRDTQPAAPFHRDLALTARSGVTACTALAALADPRGFGLPVQIIAGIARAHAAAVRDWLAGRATPPDAAALRLRIAVRVLENLMAAGRKANVRQVSVASSHRIKNFADLVARHCRN